MMENEIDTTIVLYTVNVLPNSPMLSRMTYWLWKVVPVVLLSIGTFGNLLNLLILARRNMMKYKTTFFLTFLACADLVTLWALSLRAVVWYHAQVDIKVSSPFVCAMYEYLTYGPGGFSSWLLMLMTLERGLSTSFSILSKSIVTRRNILIPCILALVISLSVCIHLPVGFSITEFPFTFNGTVLATFKQCLPSLGFDVFYKNTWSMLLLVLYNIIPLLIISIGNFIIAFRIRHRHVMNTPRSDATSSWQARQNAATRTLFLLSAFYIGTTLPHCLFGVYVIFLPEMMSPSAPNVPWLQFGRALTHFFVTCNSTFNFVLYFVSGSLFKRESVVLLNSARNFFSNIYKVRNSRDN